MQKDLASAVRMIALAALFAATALLGGAACAGANGDPAPTAPEAGTEVVVSCVDAGATE